MTVISLNAGNLWTDPYLDRVIEWNREFKDIQVRSLFGSLAGLTPTARSIDRLPRSGWAQAESFTHRAQLNNIGVRYTLNPSCIGPIQEFKSFWDTELKSTIQRLHNIGVREWTITSPLLVELLRDMFPDDFIEVSTIVEVSTPEDAVRWKALGANGVNVSTSINRDFKRLEAISRTLAVSVLANEGCLYRCPWRRDCYNMSSHDSQRGEELFGFYPFRRCNEQRLRDPVEWLRARLVLPQWMMVYRETAGINQFKIAYRTHPIDVALPILRAYMEQYWGGNLCELWPTISRLGNTIDPRGITFISAKKMDEIGFLKHWVHGEECPEKVCDSECFYCLNAYWKCRDDTREPGS